MDNRSLRPAFSIPSKTRPVVLETKPMPDLFKTKTMTFFVLKVTYYAAALQEGFEASIFKDKAKASDL